MGRTHSQHYGLKRAAERRTRFSKLLHGPPLPKGRQVPSWLLFIACILLVTTVILASGYVLLNWLYVVWQSLTTREVKTLRINSVVEQ